MSKKEIIKHLSPVTLAVMVVVISFIVIVSTAFKSGAPVKGEAGCTDTALTSGERMAEESKQAFLKAYTVFMHPRCMNCHPNGNQPLQGDDSHVHLQNVVRGVDGKGVYAMKCKNCHQDKNLAAPWTPPGNPHWQMPPANRPMVFQGKSPRELATHFKNNQFTGFKTLNDMIKHVDEESLVLSSFDPPGGFTRIPMSHKEFVDAVKEWIAKGAAIPDK